jgi:hypothetical protein
MDASINSIEPVICFQPKNEIDQMTLSLLMNKQSYDRIIQKQNPEKSRELMEYQTKIEKFRDQIMEITHDKLCDSDLQITNSIDDVFDGYVKAIIRHLEQKERAQANKFNRDDSSMFETIDEPKSNMNKSYWGKHTVVKQGYLTNDYFAKSTDK